MKPDTYTITVLTAVFLLLSLSCGQERIPGQSTEIDRKVDSILALMTLEEKIGQMTAFTSGWDVTGPVLRDSYRQDIVDGKCGNLFNAHTVAYNRELQRLAVEGSRLGIPLLFGYDVIHGHRTIFPIPLAEACSWSPELAERSASLAAREAAASGLNWTFNPMVDIARDPRWGRIAEGAGEDTYLGELFAAARVRGYQGNDLSDPFTLAACVKHIAAYGAPQAGRDYHVVDLSGRTLREVYLPPYKAAVDAGVASAMTSFNEINGVPVTASRKYLTEILRNQWGFDGLIVSDYTAINELVAHGVAGDLQHAGDLSVHAGVDIDMQGAVYYDHLARSVEEGRVSEDEIDRAVRRVLTLKYRLGLFDDPYRYLDEQRERETLFSEELMEHSLHAGLRSMVLLKNDTLDGMPLLPVSRKITRIALIGPLAENQVDLLGSWHASGDASRVTTVLSGLRKQFSSTDIRYARGCDIGSDDRSGFAEALNLARNSRLVIMAVGESFIQSGEAASRSELHLPGVQQQLVEQIHRTGVPVIAVIFAGRPLTIPWMAGNIPAILYAWQPGTRGGDAVADILSGDYNPSGRLVVTFPRDVGQIPIFYNAKNTGRPFQPGEKYTSQYLDVPNDPLYPFGFGLSYSRFEYGEPRLDKNRLIPGGSVNVSVTVTNRGTYSGEETVQLYIRDMVGSLTRPVRELKGFAKVLLDPGQQETVTFSITEEDLKFHDIDMNRVAEPGEFRVFTGPNSRDVQEAIFTLTRRDTSY